MKAWLVGSNCSAVPFIANILVQCKGNIRIFADFFRREMAEFSWLYHQTGIARPVQLLILKKYDFCWTNWISWCMSPFSAKTIFSFVCIKVKRRDLIRWRSVQYVRPTKIIDVEIEGNTNVLRELKWIRYWGRFLKLLTYWRQEEAGPFGFLALSCAKEKIEADLVVVNNDESIGYAVIPWTHIPRIVGAVPFVSKNVSNLYSSWI